MNSNIYFNNTTRKSVSRVSYGKVIRLPAFIELLLTFIDRILSIRLSKMARGWLKATVSITCLIFVIGIIGSVDAGKLTAAKGILAGIFAAIVEVLVLKD